MKREVWRYIDVMSREMERELERQRDIERGSERQLAIGTDVFSTIRGDPERETEGVETWEQMQTPYTHSQIEHSMKRVEDM